MSEPTPREAVQPAPADAPTALGFLRKHAMKLVLSVALGGGFVWVLARGGLPVLPPRGSLASLDWSLVCLAELSFLASGLARAHRARYLMLPLAPIPRRVLVAVGWVSLAAIVLAPFRIGEFVRPYLFAARARLRFMEVAGTLFAERVIDGLTLSALLLGSLAAARPLDPPADHVGELAISPQRVEPAARLVALAFGGVLVAMLAFYRFREPSRRLVAATLGRVSARLGEAVSGLVERFAEGLRFLPSARLLGLFMAESAIYWGGNAWGASLLTRAAGMPPLSLTQSVVVLGVVGLGVLVPAAPGFFGAFQLSAFVGLALYVPPDVLPNAGALFVFVFYVMQVGTTILLGLVGLGMDPGLLRARTEDPA
jgi:glycosyltransferase 2 family protein